MPRGGKRQGTPGKAYVNRTDMGQNYDMSDGKSPAAGGLPAPKDARPMQLPVYPEDTPMLTDPTNNPAEPITAGLNIGPGRTPEMGEGDPRVAETQRIAKKWGPILRPLAEDPETPDSVRTLFRYLRGMG